MAIKPWEERNSRGYIIIYWIYLLYKVLPVDLQPLWSASLSLPLPGCGLYHIQTRSEWVSEWMMQEIKVNGMISNTHILHVYLCYRLLIGHCLATEIFIGKLPATRGGVGDHRVGQWWEGGGVMGQQTSCKTLIGVHLTTTCICKQCFTHCMGMATIIK